MAEISKLAAGSPLTIAGPRSPPRMAPSRVRRSRFAKVFASPWQPRHFCLSVGCTVSENTTEGAGAAVSQPAAANRELHATNLRDQYLRHTSSGLTPIRITTGQTLRRLILPNSRTTIHQYCSLPRRFLLDRRNGIRPTARIRGTAGAERLGVTTLSRFVPLRLAPPGPSGSGRGRLGRRFSRDRRVEGRRGDSSCHVVTAEWQRRPGAGLGVLSSGWSSGDPFSHVAPADLRSHRAGPVRHPGLRPTQPPDLAFPITHSQRVEVPLRRSHLGKRRQLRHLGRGYSRSSDPPISRPAGMGQATTHAPPDGPW